MFGSVVRVYSSTGTKPPLSSLMPVVSRPSPSVTGLRPTAERRIDAARAEIYKEALKLGGTVTGEHGTGLTKKAYLGLQRGAAGVAVTKAIKQALDPQGILNPGKVI